LKKNLHVGFFCLGNPQKGEVKEGYRPTLSENQTRGTVHAKDRALSNTQLRGKNNRIARKRRKRGGKKATRGASLDGLVRKLRT